MAVSRNKLLSALDVGTSKVCCFIARFINNDDFEIIGIGHQISKGIKGGSVVDMQKTEDSIRGAIDSAEKMAGEKIKETYICFSGAKTSSEILNEETTVTGELIKNSDYGRIINIASVNAFRGGLGPAYAPSKSGVLNLTRDLAITLGRHNITVNAICPGYIETPIQDYNTPESIEEFLETLPIKRLGKPKDIAHAAKFFASKDSEWITGSYLVVDGGGLAS